MTAAPRVGDPFGRYRIDARIGEGGMGVVYLATDTAMQRQVALKVVSADLGATTEFQQRFEREASVLARLDSPHVIEIYRYGVEDGCAYIATQYVGGGDLGELLAAGGPMPVGQALAVCAQVADALQDAHRVGVIHRDVKPTNVLLRDPAAAELHAYLCDFGIARNIEESMTAPGVVTGTWSYLSPECGRGALGTPASDIYALGCLLWATLTGQAPYRGTDVEIAMAHQRDPLPALEADGALSTAVNEILRKTMAKEPSARYLDAEQLRHDLLAAAELPAVTLRMSAPPARAQRAPSAPPHQPPHQAQPAPPVSGTGGTSQPAASRRRRAVVLAIAALIVVAVAAAVVGINAASSPTPDTPQVQETTGPSNSASADPSSPASPTDEPTSAATGDGKLPTRLDRGGPVTGDLDQDGLGDVAVVYSKQRRGSGSGEGSGVDSGAFYDVTDFLSDGGAFAAAETVPDNAPRGFVQDTTFGDFDGDELLERLTVRTATGSTQDVRLRAELSGGGTLDAQVPQARGARYLSVGVADINGDATDDVVLQRVQADGGLDDPRSLDVVLVADGEVADPRPFFDNTEVGVDTTLGDFDGDGLGDVALVSAEDPDKAEGAYAVRFFLNDGDGGTTAGPDTTYQSGLVAFGTSAIVPFVLAADLDGDEDQELVVVGYQTITDVAALDLRGTRVSGPKILADFRSIGANPAVTVSDVDGDGLDDLVALASGRRAKTRLLVGRNRGESSFSVSRWATWDRSLKETGFDFALDFQGRPLP